MRTSYRILGQGLKDADAMKVWFDFGFIYQIQFIKPILMTWICRI